MALIGRSFYSQVFIADRKNVILKAQKPDNCTIGLDWGQMFLEVNDIAMEKQVAVLPMAIGGEIYTLLQSLLAPVKPTVGLTLT